MTETETRLRKAEELRSFFFLTIIMVPVLTITFVAIYGFSVWFYQMLIGGLPHRLTRGLIGFM
jgi:nitrate reductase NapE